MRVAASPRRYHSLRDIHVVTRGVVLKYLPVPDYMVVARRGLRHCHVDDRNRVHPPVRRA